MSTEFTVPEVFVSPVIPIRDVVVFPHTVLPIFIGRAKSLKAVEAAMQGDRRVILVTQRDPKADDPKTSQLFDVGVAAKILQMLKLSDGTVKALVDNGTVVITVGGGGIPVVRKDGKLYGTPAVIDKDFASAKLAELLDADMLVILTAVEKVAINFGKPDQKGLDDLTPADARKYIEEKQFAPGSMLPKVQAALSFAESKPGRVALITLLEKAADGISGKTGTRVHQ